MEAIGTDKSAIASDHLLNTNVMKDPSHLIALVLMQLVVELPVYPDQSPAWDYAEDP
jgi:hypothetical protein